MQRRDAVGDALVGLGQRLQVLGAGLEVVEALGLEDDGQVVDVGALVDLDQAVGQHADGAFVAGANRLELLLGRQQVVVQRGGARGALAQLRAQLLLAGGGLGRALLQLGDLDLTSR